MARHCENPRRRNRRMARQGHAREAYAPEAGGKMKLREMKEGETGRVVSLDIADAEYRQKLLRMGLIRGTRFRVVRKAPFGGPIEIEVRGFRLVLRSNEADAFDVERAS